MSSYSNFALLDVNIEGLGIVTAVPEYTSQTVVDEYAEYLKALVRIFNYGTTPTQTDTPSSYITETDVTEVLNQLNALRDLAQNGRMVGDKREYITQAMATDIDVLLKSLKAVGVMQPGGPAPTIENLSFWRDIAQQSPLVQGVMQSLTTHVKTGASSLQALIELIYVRQGNQIIGEGLDKLEEALGLTKEVLDALTILQTMHNNVTVNSRGDFSNYQIQDIGFDKPIKIDSGVALTVDGGLVLSSFADKFKADIITAISAFFSPPLGPETNLIGLATNANLPYGDAFVNQGEWDGTFEGGSTRIVGLMKNLVHEDDIAAQTAYYSSLGYSVYGTLQAFTLEPLFPDALSYGPDLPSGIGVPPGTYYFLKLVSRDAVNVKNQMLSMISTLGGQMATLLATTPSAVLIDPIKRQSSPLGKLSVIYHDLINTLSINGTPLNTNTGIISAVGAINKWLVDNYTTVNGPGASDAGKYQQNITNAITAFESLNDSQKEDVRNTLFVFEEFYKSASAMLQAITQIIQKMADKITR